MARTVKLGNPLTLSELLEVVSDLEQSQWPRLTWSARVCKRIEHSVQIVQKLAAAETPAYGINTGFGILSDVRIAPAQLQALQENVLRSHAAGVGDPLPAPIAALAVILRLQCLSLGYSGVRLDVLRTLSRLIEAGYIPVVPCQGSVGACGDLAPLAHIGLCVLGEGQVKFQGQEMPTSQALKKLGLSPVRLGPKEGIALVNGTQVSAAILCTAYAKALQLLNASSVIFAMSLDGFEGSMTPFDARVAKLRNHPGVALISERICALLAGSEILKSHENCSRMQDPYSFRCGAQVLGMAWETLQFVGHILEREVNAVTDNPVVMEGGVMSNGNFHGEGIAFAADFSKIALAEVGNISERRLNKLLDPRFNLGAPAFLAGQPGVESGLMMVQVTAASLVNENKTYAMPQSVDSIPTNLDKEDHVSMATNAARFCLKVMENLSKILACECLGAYRSLLFRRPRKSSKAIESVMAELSTFLPPTFEDQVPAESLQKLEVWLSQSAVLRREFQIFRDQRNASSSDFRMNSDPSKC